MSSTSSQTSSEHDPTGRTHLQAYNVSPSANWPDESASYFPPPSNLASSPQSSSKPAVSNAVNAQKDAPSNETPGKTFDQVPEYKLFGTGGPSIHSLLFGSNENSQPSQRPVTNGIDHDLRLIERRLMGKTRSATRTGTNRTVSSSARERLGQHILSSGSRER